MKIHLHKNARTTPAQRMFIQNATDLSITQMAARLGVSETTVRRWKRRSSVLDRSHTPKKVCTTLDPFQELTAVLARVVLRCGLDDLLGLVQRFILSEASRSGLNRCLNRYAIARLSPLQKLPDRNFKEGRGTCFYHTQICLPGPPLTAAPLILDTLLDCSFRCACVRISSCREKTALPFIRKRISEFPFTPLALFSVPPVFLGKPDPPDAIRRRRRGIEQFCHEEKLDFYAPDPIPRATREKLCRTWSDLEKNVSSPQPSAGPEQIRDRISGALDAYHTTPLRALRQVSPHRALLDHYREFPGSFTRKPTNLMGPDKTLPATGAGRHSFCLPL